MTTPGAVLVINTLEPSNDALFPVVVDTHVKGGAHAVADVAARDAIPSHLLSAGTLAVLPDGTQYVWSGAAWIEVPGGDIDAAISAHVAATDPHGDRAYADDLVLVDATALEAGNIGLPGWHVLSSGVPGFAGRAGLSYVVPIFVSKTIVVDRIETNISTAAVGGLLDVSVWRCTLVDGEIVPTVRIFNQTGIDASATGVVQITGLSLSLDRGTYAVVGTVNDIVTLNRVVVNAPGARCLRNGGSTNLQVVQAYSADTGYPAPEPWTTTVVTTTANGTLGYRAQFALGWT